METYHIGDRVEYVAMTNHWNRFDGNKGTVYAFSRENHESLYIVWDKDTLISKSYNPHLAHIFTKSLLRKVVDVVQYDPKQQGDRDDDI